MPRYFFDIHDGATARDTRGAAFSDVRSAGAEALRRAAERVADPAMLAGGAIVMTVRDGPDSVALTLRLVCQFEPAFGLIGALV